MRLSLIQARKRAKDVLHAHELAFRLAQPHGMPEAILIALRRAGLTIVHIEDAVDAMSAADMVWALGRDETCPSGHPSGDGSGLCYRLGCTFYRFSEPFGKFEARV